MECLLSTLHVTLPFPPTGLNFSACFLTFSRKTVLSSPTYPQPHSWFHIGCLSCVLTLYPVFLHTALNHNRWIIYLCQSLNWKRQTGRPLSTESYRAQYLEYGRCSVSVFEKRNEWNFSLQLFSELKEVISLNFCHKGASFYSEPVKHFYQYFFSYPSSHLFHYQLWLN